MEVKRTYQRRGTPDLPVGTYIAIAGQNMNKYLGAAYHPEIEITMQVTGTITMEVGSKKYVLREGDILIIPANVTHNRTKFSDDARIHNVIFSPEAIRMGPGHFFQEEFVQPLMEGRLEFPSLLQPGHPAHQEVYELMMQLEQCRIFEKNYRQRRLFTLMGICLTLMPYCKVITYDSPVSDPGHEGVKLCMRYLHNNHTEKVTLADLSEHCHLHPNYLCKLFRQYTGESIFEYLTRIRVESAQRLLLEGLPVKIVAELSGFQSERLLYRKFKERTGITPLTYRKQKTQTED